MEALSQYSDHEDEDEEEEAAVAVEVSGKKEEERMMRRSSAEASEENRAGTLTRRRKRSTVEGEFSLVFFSVNKTHIVLVTLCSCHKVPAPQQLLNWRCCVKAALASPQSHRV